MNLTYIVQYRYIGERRKQMQIFHTLEAATMYISHLINAREDVENTSITLEVI